MPTLLTWQLKDGSEASAKLDIDTEETHELTNTVTEHEVEAGADVADHVRVNLARFTVSGYVSNAPLLQNLRDETHGAGDVGQFVQVELQLPAQPFKLGASQLLAAGVSALSDLVTGGPTVPSIVMFRLTDAKDRVRFVASLLEDVRLRAAPVRILTRVREYEDMQIASVTITRTPDDGTGATFTIALQQVKFVSSELVDRPEPAELSGQAHVNAGSKHAKEEDAPTAETRESLLHQLAPQLGKTLGNFFGGAQP